MQRLLWIDSRGGLFVGALVVPLAGVLSRVYAIPYHIVLVMGIANLAYGTYSYLLERRAQRPRAMILALIAANAAWALLCAGAAIAFLGEATPLGLALLVFEGLYVGGLAALEFRYRGLLLVGPPPPSSASGNSR